MMSDPISQAPQIRVVGPDYQIAVDTPSRALQAAVVRLLDEEIRRRVRPVVATRVLITFGTPEPK
jgi:hypothetical protein